MTLIKVISYLNLGRGACSMTLSVTCVSCKSHDHGLVFTWCFLPTRRTTNGKGCSYTPCPEDPDLLIHPMFPGPRSAHTPHVPKTYLCSYTPCRQHPVHFTPGSDGGMSMNHIRSPGEYEGKVTLESPKGFDLII